ncbi:MAG: hypothetical protein CMP98_06590 [Gammaproteobacteria bacterium]|nr:hypothetical protein [Gammaproteobacteria bacterium]OUU09751.1 MAG: hypothetical protein CBB94_06750 [Gammaproteobacteria bacterium TMED34]
MPGRKFIDPDCLLTKPAYKLAAPIGEYITELVEGDAAQLGLRRCQRLAARTKLDADAIWQ